MTEFKRFCVLEDPELPDPPDPPDPDTFHAFCSAKIERKFVLTTLGSKGLGSV